MALITDISLWALFKHLRSWLTNLQRAHIDRKVESISALRAVVKAARHTRAYVRQLNDGGKQNHQKEAELSDLWTELGFRLEDLGLTALAKRCDISGRYWSDPLQFETGFMERADVGLARMEKLSRNLIKELNSK